MAKEQTRYRKVQTSFWNDRKVRELSFVERSVFLSMLTLPETTPIGLLRANVYGLAYDIGLEVEAFKEAFDVLLSKGFVEVDETAGLIWLRNYVKHNLPESPNVVISWAKVVHHLPESPLKDDAIRAAGVATSLMGNDSRPFLKAFIEAFGEGFAEDAAKRCANQRTENREQREERKDKNAPSGAYASPPDGGDAPAPVETDQGEEATAKPEDATPAGEAEETGEGEADASQAGKVPPCPYARIVAAYNDALGGVLPRVLEATETRKRTMRSRWTTHPERQSLDWWRGYFERVARSRFLTGQKNKFRASFDWLINPGNMVKVLEGNYDEKNSVDEGVTHGDVEQMHREWADPSRNRWANPGADATGL